MNLVNLMNLFPKSSSRAHARTHARTHGWGRKGSPRSLRSQPLRAAAPKEVVQGSPPNTREAEPPPARAADRCQRSRPVDHHYQVASGGSA